MPTLYELSTEIEHLWEQIEEAELEHEIEAAINNHFHMCELMEDKVDGYCKLIQERKARAEARRVEAARLAELAESDELRVQKLKDCLRDAMERTGKKKIETDNFKLSVCMNGGHQSIEYFAPPETFPKEFQKIKILPDTDKVRASLKAGDILKFAELKPRGSHVRIR